MWVYKKSGTTSFQHLFLSLGLKSIHWTYNNKFIGTEIKKNKENGRKLLHGFENIDCITQLDVCFSKEHCYWPQITDYEQLYKENPMRFLLEQRDPIKILNSFKRWNNYNKRLTTFNPEILDKTDDISFINFVLNHYQNIINFFTKVGAKFLTYDIENDNIKKLNRFIDTKNIASFPIANKNNKSIHM